MTGKRQLLVDPETAPTVKRIFELSKQGNSVHQIARALCEDGILIPRAYRAMKNGTLDTSTGFKFPTDWVGKNVKMILENQVYLGHTVSHKTQTKSFKNKKLVSVPKEEWIIVRNTHEAIVDKETFELVQKFISVKKRPNKTGFPNMFVGLVKCPDCGRNMAFSNPNGREPRFRCRTYARNSNLCTTHAISYDALQQIVMGDIQKHIKSMEALGDQFIEEMHELSEKGGGQKIKQFRKDLEIAEKRIAEIDNVIMKLFEQNALVHRIISNQPYNLPDFPSASLVYTPLRSVLNMCRWHIAPSIGVAPTTPHSSALHIKNHSALYG